MSEEKNEQGSFPASGKVEEEHPSADWSLLKLGQYAKHEDEECQGVGRKMAVHRRREGHALTLAYEQMDYGTWGKYLSAHGISHSSDARARALYAAAKTETELDGMRIVDAYERYGVEKKKPPKEKGKKEKGKKGKAAPKKAVVIDKAAVARVKTEFDKFSRAKGWDEDRRLEVLAELSFPEPWQNMVDDLVRVGSTDEVINQLHQYYDEEQDYLSRLLEKIVNASEASVPSADAIAMIDKAIDRLTEIKANAVQEQAA
jgi:hypothetical protein